LHKIFSNQWGICRNFFSSFWLSLFPFEENKFLTGPEPVRIFLFLIGKENYGLIPGMF